VFAGWACGRPFSRRILVPKIQRTYRSHLRSTSLQNLFCHHASCSCNFELLRPLLTPEFTDLLNSCNS
jgi:hypothetical protein